MKNISMSTCVNMEEYYRLQLEEYKKQDEAVRDALLFAGISEKEDCGCCKASTVYMARKAKDTINKQR